MGFTKVKDFLLSKEIIIERMTSDIEGTVVWVKDAIFAVEKAINDENVPELKENAEIVLNSTLLKLVDVVLTSSLLEVEKDTIYYFCELANNWLSLYNIENEDYRQRIRVILATIRTSRTLEEQIDILKVLHKKIYTIFMSEPIETRVSEMYRNKLEDYFSATKHGEYRV